MSQSSGERTERATPRKIREARKKGQVARSRDLSAAVSLIAVTLLLGWAGLYMIEIITSRVELAFSDMGTHARGQLGVQSIVTLLWSDAGLFARIVGPIALAGMAFSIVGSLAQTGWVSSPEAVHFNWNRMSLSSGFKKFSPIQAGGELVKALISISAVGTLAYVIVRNFFDQAPVLANMPPLASAQYGWSQVLDLLWKASLLLALLAAGDYGLQRWRWIKSLKMTRKEVKDDHKSQDGNPEVKGRVRRIQREMTRKRMLHAVKTATVVITNPTHFAVALEYQRAGMAAPVVVAKGKDLLAARIRTIAREHNVPVVENVTLARALYKTTDVGDVIPADLFGAVAEVLAYLVRLKQLML